MVWLCVGEYTGEYTGEYVGERAVRQLKMVEAEEGDKCFAECAESLNFGEAAPKEELSEFLFGDLVKEETFDEVLVAATSSSFWGNVIMKELSSALRPIATSSSGCRRVIEALTAIGSMLKKTNFNS